MQLRNLNELAKSAKARYTSGYKNREVKLHNDFRAAFESYLQIKGDTIRYLDYSGEITINASKHKIFLPNQWFCISTFLAEFVNEVVRYKAVLDKIRDNGVTGLYGRGFWDEIKNLKDSPVGALNEPLKGAIENYFKDDPQSLEYMIKFLTNYEWWNGNKTIDRNDYYVSPVLNLLGVVNVSQSYVADIVYAYATNKPLMVEALRLLEEVERSPVPAGIAIGAVNLIVYGAPGTGKSRYVEDSYPNITRVVFHPEYTYFDFVGSYKPMPVYKDSEAILKLLSGEVVHRGEPLIDYCFVPGPFIETIIDSLRNPEKTHTLLIEEINRANAPSVFGDVFQLLDRKSDGSSEYKVCLSQELKYFLLSQSDVAHFFNDGLFIPSNMNIVATMNSADQGVFVLDSAFKRRWKFKYIPIIEEGFVHQDALVPYCGDEFKWKHFLKCINNRLKDLRIDEDRLIGPYFINMHEISDYASITSKLFVYLWDDVLRHKRVPFFSESVRTYSELVSAYSKGTDVIGINDDLIKLKKMEEGSTDEDENGEDETPSESES